jgi:hypothetical protein
MNQLQAFGRLLTKYKFTYEVPVNVQVYVTESQKMALISCLKELGISGLLYSFILLIYFCIRKKGYGISLAASKGVAWTLIAISGVLLAGSTAYVAQTLMKGQAMENQIIQTERTENEEKAQPYQKFRLGIGRLMSRDNDNELSKRITRIITDELTTILGDNYVLEMDRERKGKKVNIVLVGAVGKLGHELIIAIKIIDVENSQVLFAENVQVADEKDIEPKARFISEKIADFINQKFKE